jgi:WD40 repeat protein
VHFFARSGALMSDLSEIKNAILAVHYRLKTFFLGFQMEHGEAIYGTVLSNDERFILSWGKGGTVRLWRATDGATMAVMQHEGIVWGAAFNRDESRILSWGEDGTIRLWQATDGAAVAVMQHEGGIGRATFNGDGSRILSWGGKSVQLWQATDGAPVAVMRHERGVDGVTFNGDESRILSWRDDGTVWLWDIQGDFDLPKDSLRLLVEVATGTVMDDAGNISALRPAEWRKRQEQYLKFAHQNHKPGHYRPATHTPPKATLGSGEVE